jgi:hypothetical protein
MEIGVYKSAIGSNWTSDSDNKWLQYSMDGSNLHSGPTPRGTLPAAATVKEHTAPKSANDFGCCIAGKKLGELECRDADGLEEKRSPSSSCRQLQETKWQLSPTLAGL